MAKKIGNIILLWIAIFWCYILLANMYPAFTTITASAQSATVAASSNASARVGAVEFMGVMPLIVWFIPGGLGMLATVVYLKAPQLLGGQ